MSTKRFVMVSGGSGGIGAALCRLLSAHAYTPIVVYHSNLVAAEKIASEVGGHALPMDLANEESITKAVEALSEIVGPEASLEGVVLGASPPPDLLPFGKVTSKILTKQLQINVIGPQVLLSSLTKAYFKKKKSGFVIGILTDAMGSENKAPATGMSAYVIAKGGLKNLLDACAAEHPWLKVGMVRPSFTKTKMLDVFDERYLEILQKDRAFSEPEEIAQLILSEIQR